MIPVMAVEYVVTMVMKVMLDMGIINVLVEPGCVKHLIVKIQT